MVDEKGREFGTIWNPNYEHYENWDQSFLVWPDYRNMVIPASWLAL